MERTLAELVRDLRIISRIGPTEVKVNGVSYDSRTVASGHLFMACDGLHTDGHDYIDQAIARGAVAIIHARPVSRKEAGVSYLRVEHPRFCIAAVAAAWHGAPSRELRVIGVTGTNGKSTTAFYIDQLLTLAGYRSGLISTTFLKISGLYDRNPYRASTPEAVELQGVIREIHRAGNEFAVIEATSHGLSARNNRLGSIAFETAVFTNLTHEHLEFHGTMENYRNDKANLFRFLDEFGPSHGFGVVNDDSPDAGFFRLATRRPVYGYSIRTDADLTASKIESTLSGTDFTVHSLGDRAGVEPFQANIRAPGAFNVENTLAALLTVSKITGRRVDELGKHLPKLTGVPGRMERIECGQPFALYVDFAHSPDAFARVLPIFRAATPGRLIVLFGSAGERDTGKRAVQGRIADGYADLIVLTDEDPRGESPETILNEIASGCTSRSEGVDLFLIPDRTEAIGFACTTARRGDTVLLLGKGHESAIEYADHTLAWNEREVACRCLRSLGYRCDHQ